MRPVGLLLLTVPALLAAAPAAVKDVTLTTPDGFVLKGTLTVPSRPGPRPVVILAHQFHLDRSAWKPLVEDLGARGIATLALDLRGHGQSTKKGEATVSVTDDFQASSAAVGFDKIPADLALAARWVRKQPRIDGRRLGLAGASIGGYSVLVAAPLVRPVAVASLSPAGGWGEHPEARLARAVEEAKAAVFLLASQDDTPAMDSAAAVKGLFGVYERIVPGKAHGQDYLPTLSDTLGGWFGEYLTRHPGAAKAAAVKQDAKEMPSEAVK